MDSAIRKRSIVIGGRKTSVSLEDAFWFELKKLAHRRSASLAELVSLAAINNPASNLSSSVRLFLLDQVRMASDKKNVPLI